MKRLFAILVVALAGCTTPPANVSPAQNLINTTGTSCKSLGAAIKATDDAVLSGLLKKPAALEAIKGFTAAQTACMSALTAIQAANPGAAP